MTAGDGTRIVGGERLRAAVAREAWRGAVAVTDLLPPRWRYGQLRRVTTALFGGRALPVVSAPASVAPATSTTTEAPSAGSTSVEPPLRCVLLTSGLDVGGVEQVVATLARGLSREGVATTVVASSGGRISDALRAAGVPVVLTDDPVGLTAVLAAAQPDVVQLHNAPLRLVETVVRLGLPIVPVVHNMEIHRNQAQWAQLASAWQSAVCTVAVSDVAARHHVAHMIGGGVPVVIPNGASATVSGELPDRTEARTRLRAAVGPVADDDVVVLCLARYDAQKNLPGLVRAFDRAVDRNPRLRLVVAGTVGDVIELRRAEAVRRAGRHSGRVHLLGASDPATLLAASDLFVLDSFIEGWPVAATEAAAAGLPLVLADAGGASELAAGRTGRAVVVANAAGPAELVDDRAVRATRRARRQANERELADAIVDVANLRADRVASVPPELSEELMVRRHAEVLRRAARPAVDSARTDGCARGPAR